MKMRFRLLLILLILLLILISGIFYYSSLYVINFYGQSPNITTTECIENGGEINTLGCKSENDFLGTIIGVKCQCVCCNK
ncbi:MAG: hypothetical protein Q7S27_05765 [Nanoarchaeota archaeon]|nr:hypothetical protein [Nanoarchaeota archaeon]